MSQSTPAVAYIGVAVSVALAVLAIVDQTSAHWTRSDVASHYGSHGLNPDPNLLTILLAVSFLCATLFFALEARTQSRGKKGAARGLAIAVAVLPSLPWRRSRPNMTSRCWSCSGVRCRGLSP